jgi:mannonate dehydratase
MNRRQFLKYSTGIGAMSLALNGCRYWPAEGLLNPCLPDNLPHELKNHDVVQRAWQGIDVDQFWDCHTHLIGLGDSDSGIWVSPHMRSLLHPIQFTQFTFYLNGSCADANDAQETQTIDERFVNRLVRLHDDFSKGAKFMLIAFEHHYDGEGKQRDDLSPFYTPNHYAAKIAGQYPQRFEWIASVHPYREDCLAMLQWCVRNGARAIKWLPGAMGIDPGSRKCDQFYEAVAKYRIPLLTHSGEEQAVSVSGSEGLNNPLLMRRALEHGVRVIFAHCASLGESVDLDKGPNGARVSNLDLFYRLLAEKNYQERLYGDISAITQVNRDKAVIEAIFTRTEWHANLINGSDYPLPGVFPIISTQSFADWGYIQQREADVLAQIRRFNPLLFDFVLKRIIKVNANRLAPAVFESRRVFSA